MSEVTVEFSLDLFEVAICLFAYMYPARVAVHTYHIVTASQLK